MEVISKELALEEIKRFLAKFERKEFDNISEQEIEEEYYYILEALMSGNLSFDNELNPTYNLIKPIKDEDGNILYSELKIKTRIKPSVQGNMLDSAGPKKQGTLSNALTSHILGFSSPLILDKLSVKDFNFLYIFSSLFISGGY